MPWLHSLGVGGGSKMEADPRLASMTRTELIIQLLKVAIGLAFGAYFVWWSLEVLDRLTLDNNVPTAAVRPRIMKTEAFGPHEDRTPTHGYAESREAAMAAFAKSWRRPISSLLK
jgi:hypothetical protein